MARVAVSPTIEIEYETFGDPADPTLLLVCGWGQQLVAWSERFIERLVERGLHVVRFDNRDTGLSTKIEDGSTYLLEDMADDAFGLLDELSIDAAHLMGQSMGGMIAQTMAIHRPERVLSLTSLYSTTGAPDVGGADPSLVGILARPAGTTRDERIASGIESSRAIWGDTPEFPFDEELARWRAEASHDRSWYPAGKLRQLVAIRDSGDRTTALRQLRVPTLVVHGDNDPLINMSGGEATAAAIEDAELLIVHGMGHLLAPPAWDRILDAFDRLLARAAAAAADAATVTH